MNCYPLGETTYDILLRHGQPLGSCPGGSAYNASISLGRCNVPVYLVTTVGNDQIGHQALEFLIHNGVQTNYIHQFEGRSRLALAFMDDENNASYSFYPASVQAEPIYPEPKLNDIILLGSSFAVRDHGRSALIDFLSKAKQAGAIIIYDPNTREPVKENSLVLEKIRQNCGLATIVKGSDQDFFNIFGINDPQEVYQEITRLNCNYLIYTKGSQGVEMFGNNLHVTVKAKPVRVISTIGAGDNFSAGLVIRLYYAQLGGKSVGSMTKADWIDALELGTTFSAEVCSSENNYISHKLATSISAHYQS